MRGEGEVVKLFFSMSSVLENTDYNVMIPTISAKDKLMIHMKEYIKNSNSHEFIVSLSGGVDSMVIASSLKSLGANVTCIHINYNNRQETTDEAEFLKQWTKDNDIELIYEEFTIKRGDIRRDEYEKFTRDTRFDLYRSVLKRSGAKSICLGHHDDDIIENVFNNLCKGRNILDLTVMRRESTLHGVNISRPLIGLRKNAVYEFAHKYKTPYFKDTTPTWSLRGTFRRILVPLISEKFGNGFEQNMLHISQQSDDWCDIIDTHVVQPMISSCQFNEDFILIPLKNHQSSKLCFWKHIFAIVFHKLGKPCPSNKSLINLLNNIKKPGSRVQLNHFSSVMVHEDRLEVKIS